MTEKLSPVEELMKFNQELRDDCLRKAKEVLYANYSNYMIFTGTSTSGITYRPYYWNTTTS